jgi:hypothetical protein
MTAPAVVVVVGLLATLAGGHQGGWLDVALLSLPLCAVSSHAYISVATEPSGADLSRSLILSATVGLQVVAIAGTAVLLLANSGFQGDLMGALGPIAGAGVVGVVLGNGSPPARSLARGLWRDALPVVGIYFVTLAATLPWSLGMVPIAAVIVVSRIGVTQLAVSAALHREDAEGDSLAGLAFLTQGATVWVLAGLVAAVLPADAVTLLITVAALNLLIGPSLLRVVLRRLERAGLSAGIPEPIRRLRDRGVPEFESSDLTATFSQLSKALQQVTVRFREELITTQSDRMADFLGSIRSLSIAGLERIERSANRADSRGELTELITEVRLDLLNWLQGAIETEMIAQEEAQTTDRLSVYVRQIHRVVAEQPSLTVPWEPARFEAHEDDRLQVRLLKWRRRLRRRLLGVFGIRWQPQRVVSIDQLGALHIGGRFGRDVCLAANSLAHQRLDLWRRVRILLDHTDRIHRYALEALVSSGEIDGEEISHAREELSDEFDVADRALRTTGDELLRQFGRRLNEVLGETGRAAQLAGTSELSDRPYRLARVALEKYEHRKTLEAEGEAWTAISRASAAALAMRIRGEQVLHRFASFSERCVSAVREELLSPLEVFPEEVALELSHAKDRLTAAFDRPDAESGEVFETLRSERVALDGFIRRIAVGELASYRDPRNLGRPFHDLLEPLERELFELPEFYETRREVWTERDLDAPPSDVGIVRFPFRELVREVLEDEVRVRFLDCQRRLEMLFREAVGDLTDLARFLAFNFEAAEMKLLDVDGSVDEGIDAPREVVIGALEQAIERARAIAAVGEVHTGEIAADVARITIEQAGLLRGILRRADLEEARRRSGLAEITLRRPDPEETRESGEWSRRLRLLVYDLAGRRLTRLAGSVRTHLGMQAATGDGSPESLAAASFRQLDGSGIPRTYRRLFETAAFGVEDILAGQEAELASMGRAVERWRSGKATAIAVVGQRGAGRTTLVERALRRHLAGAPLHRLCLTGRVTGRTGLARELSTLLPGRKTDRLDVVARRLRQRDEPRVVVIEEIQHLFLRSLGGFEPLVDFLELVTSAPSNTLWIVTVDAAAWSFMDTFFSAAEAFTQVLSVPRLTREETELLVLRRHQVSGLKLAFQVGERLEPLANTMPEVLHKERYFDQLHHVARGHPVMTMFHWLVSIKAVDEPDAIVVGTPVSLDTELIRRMEADRLLSLASFMVHGTLTEQEFARVMRVDSDRSAATLSQLEAVNLIGPVPGKTATYAINDLLYTALFGALKHRSMI